ncbi:MAG: nicotinate-nucleotide--dimethylbenzimidazole phosphoribosyltransferase [Candidatus Hydrogenedentes bacterium]|nr:nicotinate-nucleotide--dimethylbenzimidazole phosphoribosyltransferase [Candidatus Hydrogenedentota bacterium]
MSLLARTIEGITPADPEFRDRARARILTLCMPPWALGRLLDLAVDLAGMTRSLAPPVARRCVVVMAADHGVTAEGVSAFPREVTVEMVRNLVAGGAGVNVLGRQAGARVLVVDVGVAGDLSDLRGAASFQSRPVAHGTANMACGPAMRREQAIQAVEAGLHVAAELADETDVFATGEMGIGNTTPSSAIIAALCAVDVSEAAGRGTGIDDVRLRHKTAVIRRALDVNQPDPGDPIDVLAKVGGFEIGAIAGLILGAAAQRKPVLVDGLISTAGALLAHRLCPHAAEYMIASHRSDEPGHGPALAALGKRPLLDLGLRLGEGTGAALAMPLVEAAARILTEMASFDDAQVSKGNL